MKNTRYGEINNFLGKKNKEERRAKIENIVEVYKNILFFKFKYTHY